MAHGTPVVTSNASSLPEVVGKAAVLVNPENVFEIMRAVHRVLLDPTLRATLRERGYEQAQRFSWDASARKILKVYEEVGGARTNPTSAPREQVAEESPAAVHLPGHRESRTVALTDEQASRLLARCQTRGFPGETRDSRCNLSVIRFLSASAVAAARRLRSLLIFSLRARRRRISGERLCPDMNKSSWLVWNVRLHSGAFESLVRCRPA